MRKKDTRLIVVGDRVLIAIEEGEERTKVGLYLPPTAVDNQAVQGGRIVATGPGLPMPDPGESSEEPWRTAARETRFVPTPSFSDAPLSRSPSRATDISSCRKRRFSRSCAKPRVAMTTDAETWRL